MRHERLRTEPEREPVGLPPLPSAASTTSAARLRGSRQAAFAASASTVAGVGRGLLHEQRGQALAAALERPGRGGLLARVALDRVC